MEASGSSSFAADSASGQGVREQQMLMAWNFLVRKVQWYQSLQVLVLENYRNCAPMPQIIDCWRAHTNSENMVNAWTFLVDKARTHQALEKIVESHYLMNNLAASGQGDRCSMSWGVNPVDIVAACVAVANSSPINHARSVKLAGRYRQLTAWQHGPPAKVPRTMLEARAVPLAKEYGDLQVQEVIAQELKEGHRLQEQELERSQAQERSSQEQRLQRARHAVDHAKQVLEEKLKAQNALADGTMAMLEEQRKQMDELQELQKEQLSYQDQGSVDGRDLSTQAKAVLELLRKHMRYEQTSDVGRDASKLLQDMREILRQLSDAWYGRHSASGQGSRSMRRHGSRSRSRRRQR